MAIHLTRNSIKDTFCNIYYVGYCELEYTLTFAKKIGYTYGVYGWNYSVYMLDNDTVILTGYRGMFGDRIPFELSEKIEKKAREIRHDNSLGITEKRKKIENLCKKLAKTMNDRKEV